MPQLFSPLLVIGLTLVLAACGGGGGSSDSGNGDTGGGGGGGSGLPPGPTQQQLESLGEKLFQDTDLSSEGNQSCESCHDPASGFADPDDHVPVSEGSFGGRLGTRNSPTISYAAFIPVFSSTNNGGMITHRGGQFLDGRQPRLEEQAQQPFLNPIEMNMADKAAVINVVANAAYAAEFMTVFGADSLLDVDAAYINVSEAIAAFERSDTVSPFTSKFDDVKLGSDVFTQSEADGEEVFIDANCGRCHTNVGVNPVFSNFEYENIGVPANPFVLANSMDSMANPVGNGFIDNGLGPVIANTDANGKFRTPTLRNVALTAPYMHNGVFNTLAEVIDFYDSRDPMQAEVPATVTNVDVGALGLTAQQKIDLEAFLNTLTDQ